MSTGVAVLFKVSTTMVLSVPSPQQMLKLLPVPQNVQGNNDLSHCSRGLILCKYYDFLCFCGGFSQNPKRRGRWPGTAEVQLPVS